MKTRTEQVLIVLRVLAWLGVVGYAVNLGSQLISFTVSCFNPVAAQKMPGVFKNLLPLLEYNFWHYVFVMSFVIVLSAVFLHLWYTVTSLLSKLNLENPFTPEVSRKLEAIAYSLLSIWVVSFMGENYTDWLSKTVGENLHIIHAENEFLFTAGIVFIISQVFKRGIEIQEENQQTI